MDNMNGTPRYDWVLCGQRIKLERERINMSQQELADTLAGDPYYATGVRQTISDWEKGKKKEIPLHTLVCLCNIFNCDMGYLLGEYDCRTRPVTDIHAYTGLSETAIETLHALTAGGNTFAGQKMYTRHVIPFLNQLLSDPKTVERFAGKLSVYAATTDMKRNLNGTLDERTDMYQAGAIFELSRVFAEQAEIMFAPADEPEKKPVVIP